MSKEQAQSRIYLFDLGGVLLDFDGPEQLSGLLDGRFSTAEIRERWPKSPSLREFELGRISASQFSAGFVAEWEIPLAPDLFFREFSTWARQPYPGALAMLTELRESVTLACITNINAAYWERVRDEMGFGVLFEHCYPSHELGLIKPDRDIYEYVLEDLACMPDEISFFDDTHENVEVAQSLGIKSYKVQGVSGVLAVLRDIQVAD